MYATCKSDEINESQSKLTCLGPVVAGHVTEVHKQSLAHLSQHT